jgi:oxalate decarboxylase/phosphoglucose isomerase-like protein (cupin superfamily)
MIVPAGTSHNVVNDGTKNLIITNYYSPPPY